MERIEAAIRATEARALAVVEQELACSPELPPFPWTPI